MSTLDATISAAPASPVAAASALARFIGEARIFWRLLVHGAVLLMFTLGIYRFWLITDIRRFLWSNTELSGVTFEYLGTARELLLGFLIAIAILVPLNVMLFLAALWLGDVAGFLLGFALLAVLGQYAVYRARRYRLTRTVYRGVRFHQSGSPVRYAICASFWWSLVILSCGLAYPFAQSQLERFKMRHTFFGDLPGRFEGFGFDLFVRGLVLWVLAVVPLLAGLIATLAAIDWEKLTQERADQVSGWIEDSGLGGAIPYAAFTLVWLALSLAFLYPIFQAVTLRWWLSGLRFGEVVVTSRLRAAHVLGIYGRFLWHAFLFTLVVIVLAVAAAYAIPGALEENHSTLSEWVATAALVVTYVIAALGYSTIYQATVRLGLWRCVADNLDIAGAGRLEHVTAAGEAASPIGEGLADALNVGDM